MITPMTGGPLSLRAVVKIVKNIQATPGFQSIVPDSPCLYAALIKVVRLV